MPLFDRHWPQYPFTLRFMSGRLQYWPARQSELAVQRPLVLMGMGVGGAIGRGVGGGVGHRVGCCVGLRFVGRGVGGGTHGLGLFPGATGGVGSGMYAGLIAATYWPLP